MSRSKQPVKKKEDKILIDDIVTKDEVVRLPPRKASKEIMLEELMSVIEDYNYGQDKVKAADKISAIKQICVMEGYNQPTVSKIIQEIEIEF